jgi:hypothetical protein
MILRQTKHNGISKWRHYIALFGEHDVEEAMDLLEDRLCNEWMTLNQVRSWCKVNTPKLLLLYYDESLP